MEGGKREIKSSYVDFEVAKKRLEELQYLKESVKGEGLFFEFYTKCTAYTKWSLQMYKELNEVSVKYLYFLISENNDLKRDIKLSSKELEELKEIALETINTGDRDSAIEDLGVVLNYKDSHEKLFEAKRKMTKIRSEVLVDSLNELSRILFYEIMGKSHNEFHKKSVKELILNALKKIDFFSLMDDIESIPRLIPKIRMKEQVKGASQTIMYHEEYLDELWVWLNSCKYVIGRLEKEMRSVK